MREFKKNKIMIIAILTVIAVLLTSCRLFDSEEFEDFESTAINDDQEFVVDRYNQELVIYNTETKTAESRYVDGDSCVYSFIDCSEEIYTIGDSYLCGFKLIKVNKDSVDVLYNAPEQCGLFPLFIRNGVCYLEEEKYDEELGYKSSVLISYDCATGEITKYSDMKAHIQYAAVCDDILYYTTYDQQSEKYFLYSNPNDVMNSSESVKVAELDNGELYCIAGNLYVTDGRKIKPFDGEGTSYDYYREDTYVLDDHLIQYRVTEDSDLELSIVSVSNGHEEKSVTGPVSFSYNKKQISVYAEGDIEKYDCN